VGVNSCAPEGLTVPVIIVTPVVILLKDTNIVKVLKWTIYDPVVYLKSE
jgi:hypothetical protein